MEGLNKRMIITETTSRQIMQLNSVVVEEYSHGALKRKEKKLIRTYTL